MRIKDSHVQAQALLKYRRNKHNHHAFLQKFHIQILREIAKKHGIETKLGEKAPLINKLENAINEGSLTYEDFWKQLLFSQENWKNKENLHENQTELNSILTAYISSGETP